MPYRSCPVPRGSPHLPMGQYPMSAPGAISPCPSNTAAGTVTGSPQSCPASGPAELEPLVSQRLAPPSCPPPWLGWQDGPWPPGPALTVPMGSPCSCWTLFPMGAPSSYSTLANGAHRVKQPTPPTARQMHSWKRILLQLLMSQNPHQRTTSLTTVFRGMPCRHREVTALHTGCHP